MKRVAVLVSGAGTNLQALLDAARAPGWPAPVVHVVSNVPGVGALERARVAGVPARVIEHRGRPRADFEAELVAALEGVDLVCLAGFMRVLGPTWFERFAGRTLNIHPALLPSFAGAHGIRDTLAWGVTQAGATVHLVDPGVDTGPILNQGSVAVRDDDTEATLSARVRAVEHRLYPLALRWMAEDRVRVEGRRAFVDLPPGDSRWLVG